MGNICNNNSEKDLPTSYHGSKRTNKRPRQKRSMGLYLMEMTNQGVSDEDDNFSVTYSMEEGLVTATQNNQAYRQKLFKRQIQMERV